MRVTPDGVAFPGDKPEHCTPGTSEGLISAAEELEGVILQRTPAEFDLSKPAEVFLFTDPVYPDTGGAKVGVRAARLVDGEYWGEAWEGRLQWQDARWVLSEWVRVLVEN